VAALNTGRVALVTGGAGGIGLAVAQILAEDGFGVTICDKDEERLGTAGDMLPGAGTYLVRCELTDPSEVSDLLASHADRFGRLDVLVNNAGAIELGSLTEASIDQLDFAFAANVRTAWLVTAAAIPLLRKAGQEHGQALVASLASVLGRYAVGLTATYSATKASLFALMQSIHDELSASGVRATAIGPSVVATAMTEPLVHLDRGQMITPRDVAETVRYLTRLSPTCSVQEILLYRTVDRLVRI
jgi:3-oxoacyl-[acyl-carrier protein] reductase